MTTGRSLMLAVATWFVGVIIGRAMPPGVPSNRTTASTVSTPPVADSAQDRDCDTVQAKLATTRTQLAICMAFCATSDTPTEADPSASSPSYAPLDPAAPTGTSIGLAQFTTYTKRFNEEVGRYPDAVIVRHKDGTTGIYSSDEWPPESEDVIARKFPDGHIGWYAGPDAGPRSDPDAWVRPRDLAGPDGTIMMGGVRFRFLKPDAGEEPP